MYHLHRTKWDSSLRYFAASWEINRMFIRRSYEMHFWFPRGSISRGSRHDYLYFLPCQTFSSKWTERFVLGANDWYVGKQQQDYVPFHPWFRSIPHGCLSKVFSHPNASGDKPGYWRLITACRDGLPSTLHPNLL